MSLNSNFRRSFVCKLNNITILTNFNSRPFLVQKKYIFAPNFIKLSLIWLQHLHGRTHRQTIDIVKSNQKVISNRAVYLRLRLWEEFVGVSKFDIYRNSLYTLRLWVYKWYYKNHTNIVFTTEFNFLDFCTLFHTSTQKKWKSQIANDFV